MTPKEKAEKLVDRMYFSRRYEDEENYIPKQAWNHAKQCALIAVDECIESTKQLIHHYTKLDDSRYSDIYLSMSISVNYWQQVKQEIEKL